MEITAIKKTRKALSVLICAVMIVQLAFFVSTSSAWLPVPPTPGTKLDVEMEKSLISTSWCLLLENP
jgi:hypothetical protein